MLLSDLRERIGQAAYRGQAVAQRYNTAVLMISSTARNSYAKVGGEIKEAGLGIDDDGVRFIRNPDALIGLGKESGEIEYACDSVTAGIRLPGEDSRYRTTVFATAKVRAGVPGWSALTFDGNTFAPVIQYDATTWQIEEDDEQKGIHSQRKKNYGTSEPEGSPSEFVEPPSDAATMGELINEFFATIPLHRGALVAITNDICS